MLFCKSALRALAVLLLCAAPAMAETGQSRAFMIGQGPGVQGFYSLICATAQIPIGQSGNPACGALSGDVTMTSNGTVSIGANKVTNPQMRQSAALSLIGRSANSTGNVADISATPGSSCVFMESSSALTCATIASANIANSAVTNAKLANMATNTIKANATAGSAAPTDVAVPSCSTASSALTWTTNTGFGCNSIAGGGSGAWSNTRLAKTSAYAPVTGDCGATLALGGSAFFAATFNAASGYASNCAFLVTNEDTSFGKLIIPQLASSATSFTIGAGSKAFTTTAGLPITVYSTPNSAQRYRVYSLANPANYMVGVVTAYASTTLTILVDGVGGSGTFTDWQIAPEIRLWPGQQRWVFAQNNVWDMDNATRWKLPAETEICVDAASGSNSNDGLGTGTRCFKTIQFAANVVYQDWDANNFPPDIGLYTGPFSESVGIQGQLTGYNFLRFRTRAANTWTSTGACIAISDNAEAIFDAIFSFTQTWQCNTGNAANTGAIYNHQVSVTDVNGAHKWISGGSNDSFHVHDGEGRSTINGTGAGIIIGNTGTTSGFSFVSCLYHCGGVTIGGVISYGGTISLSGYYVLKGGSILDHSANPTGTPGTIGAILALGGSTIRLNGLATTNIGGTPTTSPAGVCATSC